MFDKVRIGPFEVGPEGKGLYVGDAMELAEEIPDDSIDAIFCDPVYQDMDAYRWVAELGARVLKRGGSLIAQCAHYYLPDVMEAVKGRGLNWHWIIAQYMWGANAKHYGNRIVINWKPHVWLVKGEYQGRFVFDWLKGGPRVKRHHVWQDSPLAFVALIERVVPKGGVILDPFCGSGTIPIATVMAGRNYLAFEIDERTAQVARERLRFTQPPLILDEDVAQLLLPGGKDGET